MRTIKKTDLNNIYFYQVPKWLMDLFINGIISQGAFKTYVLMYDRTRLSAKNNWIDKNGYVYIKYSYDEMQSDLKCSRQTISNNLKDLINVDLIDKIKCFSSSSIFYLKINSSLENLTNSSLENLTNSSLENLTNSGLENLDTSNNNSSNNKYNKNTYKRTRISSFGVNKKGFANKDKWEKFLDINLPGINYNPLIEKAILKNEKKDGEKNTINYLLETYKYGRDNNLDIDIVGNMIMNMTRIEKKKTTTETKHIILPPELEQKAIQLLIEKEHLNKNYLKIMKSKSLYTYQATLKQILKKEVRK